MSRRKIKEKQKQILKEAIYLVKTHGVPLTSVYKRVGISYWKLRRIMKSNINDPTIAFSRRTSHKKF